jgi:hypothetical protein
MFRTLLFGTAIILFIIAALGAFGTFTGINYDGLVAVGFACVAFGVLNFEDLIISRRRTSTDQEEV